MLDEPFRAVDTKTVADLIALIERWHREGRTVLAALHDIEQVRAHFAHTLLLAREVVAGHLGRGRDAVLRVDDVLHLRRGGGRLRVGPALVRPRGRAGA